MKKSHIAAMSLLTALLLAIVAIPAFAVVYVDGISGSDANTGLGGWGNAKATIGAGVTVAAGQPDLTVWVRKTTYSENITVPAGVAVYGGFDGTEVPPFDLSTRTFVPPTIVQPTAAGNTAFVCSGGNVIDGFTIRGGAALTLGLGVSVLPNTTSQVSNCIIQNFQSVLGTGAGIAAIGTALTPIGLNIFNCQFSNNSAAAGAGIYATQGNASITSCTFTGDTASDAFGGPPIGGASIFTSDCSLIVTGCTFTNETASVTLAPNTLVQGGAIHATGGLIVSVGTCTFTSCVATGTNAVHTAQGGAMYIFGVNATVRNNFVYQCAALGTGTTQPANGGGIYYHNPGILNVINNTFYGNEVTPNAGLVTDSDRPYGLGSAIFITGGTNANIFNNIITHNRGTAVVNQGMVVYFNYNVLWHNQGGDIYGFSFPVYTTNPLTNKDFNIMKDPNLRGPLTGDLHILYGSPARDTGRNTGAPSTDIDGELRPNWSGVSGAPPVPPIVDIGADEFVDTGVPHDGGANNDPRNPPTTDPDADLIFNPFDNCPTTPNTTQTDSNGDQVGDTCTTLATALTPLVYYVDGTVGSSGNGQTWATAFKTIQEGIDAADSHNQASWVKNYEVWVRGGPAGQTYVENIMIWHGVAVYGAWAGTELPTDVPDPHPLRNLNTNQTTIDGNAANPAVAMAHLPQDRYLTEPPKTNYDTTITVLDSFRPFNGKGELGGGVSNYKDLVDISTCRIVSNTAALGGGVYFYKGNGIVGDGLLPPPVVLLSGLTTINTNTATGAASYAGYGGGVYCERGAPTIFANLIEGNTAFFGGGIASRFSSPDIVENLIGCQTSPNVAQGGGAGNGRGGGIYLDSNSDAAMNKLTIVSNQATGATGQGGGIYDSGSNFTMKNTIVANNTASHALAAQRGGAIFATGTSPVISNPWCFISYSDFFNNSATQFVGITDPTSPPPPSSCSQTNFAVDPLFTNPAICDYSLLAGSPLIAAGDPADGSPNVGAYQTEDPPATIGQAKDIENGVIVEISGAVVTAVFSDGFYIESTDRAAGIFVRTSSPVQIGQLVDVTGVMSTNGIEREIMMPTVALSLGTAPQIRPFAMGNKQVGGGPSGQNPGVTEGMGANNLGLLIQTWGTVTRVESSPSRYFTIDDGSRVGVKVLPPNGINLPAVGDSVVVIGISCVDYYGVGHGRMVKARLPSDVSYPSK